MFSLNRVTLIGYQTQPVQVRQTPGGASVTDLNIVVPSQFQTSSGEQLSGKSFHTVTLWGPMADVAGQFVKAGAQVFIAGRLQTDTWEDQQSGEKRSRTKVIASDLILLDPKAGQMAPPSGAKQTTLCVNRAELVGNVTKDPEIRATTSGKKVLTIGVATSDRWKDRTSGEQKERTEFSNVVVWGDLAEEVGAAVKKGAKVYVSGRVQTRSFETQAGQKRSTTEVVADQVSLLGVKNSVAAESIEMTDAGMSSEFPQVAAAGNDPVGVSVPTIDYAPEIKVEDLPF